MTTEELLKDPNACSLIEWAFREGQLNAAYNFGIWHDGEITCGVNTPFKEFKKEVINSLIKAEDIISSINLRRS